MSSSVASRPGGAEDRPIAGAVIHGYRLRRRLSARPGMDLVVEAKAPDGRLVALTLFAPELTRDKELRRRLVRLALLRASIAHPHLLPVFGVHEKRSRVLLVSEIASPWTLADRLRLGALEPDETLRILAQVASGLEAAAAKGLVHHDLSAGAIVMDEDDPANAVLTDFGISLPPAPGCELLSATESLDYRSPEQVRGEPPEPASNVYSLSCILAECLTGAPPFPYDRPLLTLHAHVVEPAPQISQRRDDLTPDIDRVIAKGMAKDPRERFASPTQMIRAAAPALGVKTPPAAIPPPRKQQPKRQRPARRASPQSRRRLSALGQVRAPVWVALALFVSALVGFATGNLDRSSGQSAPAAGRAAPAIPAAELRAAREQRTGYVEAVGRTMTSLDRRRARARRQLRRARRPRNQAAAARALAAAFGDARKSLPAPAPGLSEAPLASSMREVQRAYGALAVAARKGSPRRWEAAGREALRREREVERALAGLRSRYDQLERRPAVSTRA
jgi:serine/threonine protein kinase